LATGLAVTFPSIPRGDPAGRFHAKALHVQIAGSPANPARAARRTLTSTVIVPEGSHAKTRLVGEKSQAITGIAIRFLEVLPDYITPLVQK